MRRWTIRVLVFLLMGLVIHAGVIVACSAWLRVYHIWPLVIVPEGGTYPDWTSSVQARPGAMRVLSVPGFGEDVHDLPADEKAALSAVPSWSRSWRGKADDEVDLLLEDARGWPLLSVHCELKVYAAARTLYCSGVVDGVALDEFEKPPAAPFSGIRIRAPIYYQRAIPLRPVWTGFIVNTVFYAVLAAGLIVVPLASRRLMWVRNGRCGRCGYPVTTSPCPECGATVRD